MQVIVLQHDGDSEEALDDFAQRTVGSGDFYRISEFPSVSAQANSNSITLCLVRIRNSKTTLDKTLYNIGLDLALSDAVFVSPPGFQTSPQALSYINRALVFPSLDSASSSPALVFPPYVGPGEADWEHLDVDGLTPYLSLSAQLDGKKCGAGQPQALHMKCSAAKKLIREERSVPMTLQDSFSVLLERENSESHEVNKCQFTFFEKPLMIIELRFQRRCSSVPIRV